MERNDASGVLYCLVYNLIDLSWMIAPYDEILVLNIWLIIVVMILYFFRDYHNHKVVSCPVAGCTDSYVELQELAERKVVTMAAETLSYAHPCKGTVHIKAPPHPPSHPNQVVHNKNGLYCGITDQERPLRRFRHVVQPPTPLTMACHCWGCDHLCTPALQ